MATFAPGTALLISLAAAPEPAPPLLLDASRAIAYAEATASDAPLRSAEALLLAGDASSALVTLAGAGATARRLRLEADAHVALQDRQATALIAALSRHAGWEQHSRRLTTALEVANDRRDRVRLGSILFALTLGLLILAGARELLRVRIETAVAGIAAVGSLLLLSKLSESLMTIGGVVTVAGVALVHAGTAAVRRTAAAPRVRAMIAASMLLGFIGAAWAVFTQIGLGGLLAILSRATSG